METVDHQKDQQKEQVQDQLVAKATSVSQQLKAAATQPAGAPVAERALRENAATSTDMLVLVLDQIRDVRQTMGTVQQTVGNVQSDIKELRRRVERVEGSEQKALGVLLKERESRIEMEEEITRVDLNLKQEAAKHRREVILKVVAALATPAAVWKIVEVVIGLLKN